MTAVEDHTQLLLMRGMVASLPDEQQLQIKNMAARLREIICAEKEIGTIALALVGAELSAQS